MCSSDLEDGAWKRRAASVEIMRRLVQMEAERKYIDYAVAMKAFQEVGMFYEYCRVFEDNNHKQFWGPLAGQTVSVFPLVPRRSTLPPPKPTQFVVPHCVEEVFFVLPTMLKTNVYYRPGDPTFSTIDAFCIVDLNGKYVRLLFQDTVSKGGHDIKLNGLVKVLGIPIAASPDHPRDASKRRRITTDPINAETWFIFRVPKDLAGTTAWKRPQAITGDGANSLHNIQKQYVWPIP